MKFPSLLVIASLLSPAFAAEEIPEIFRGVFRKDTPIRAQIGMVLPPREIDKYVAKVEANARKDKEWFREYSSKAKPGVPLPYHERLGLTREEYDAYLELWNQREFKPSEEVMLLLRQGSGDSWALTATGKASTLSTLRYHPENDAFRSPNGTLQRIADIDADPSSILGKWSGREWKFEEATSLGKTKENFALGQFADGEHGLIVYRLQEMTAAGTRLLDKSLVIRFPLATPEN